MLYVNGASEFTTFMEEKRKVLQRRRDECDTALRILDYYETFRQTTLDLADTEMRIVKNPKEVYLLWTEANPEFKSDESYYYTLLQEHTRRCEERPHDVLGFPIGRVYAKGLENKIDMDSISGYCNYCIGVPDSMEDCRVINTAEYFTYLYVGPELTIDNSVVEKVFSFIEDQGYVLIKDLFVIPFTEKIIGGDRSIYYCRIFAEVKPLS